MDVNTSLLREKFLIKEECAPENNTALLIDAPSTRMPISFQYDKAPPEEYIVRTHNMHSCVRMAARIINDYEKQGPISTRAITPDWKEMWGNALSDYDKKHNPSHWLAIYHKGKCIYEGGKHHQFFDVIEKCDALNKSNYEKSIKLAEKAFGTAGKKVKITYESHVSLIVTLGKKETRSSMVLRGPVYGGGNMHCLIKCSKKEKLHYTQGLDTAADFLEGVQLSFIIGINHEKVHRGMITNHSTEGKMTADASKRISQLNALINSLENRYQVRYRPERPNFDEIIAISEREFAKSLDAAEENENSDNED